MTAQNKEAIPNLGYAGFIMKKTVQPFSLRQQITTSVSDLKNTNMVMFINKRLATIRQRLGTNHIPFEILCNPCLKIKPQHKNFEEMRKDVYDMLDKEIQSIKTKDSKGFLKEKRSKSVEETKKTERKNQNFKPKEPPAKLISSLLHTVLSEEEMLSIYYQFKLKMRKKHYSKDLSPDFIKTMQIFDEEMIIKELTDKSQLNVPRLLGINKDDIKEFISDECDEKELEKMKKIEEAKQLKNKTRRLSAVDIQNLLNKEDKKKEAQSIQSFNQTRMENMNMEKNKRKKIVMTGQSFFFKLKEKNDQMEQQDFQEHLTDIHNTIRHNANKGQSSFIRKKHENNESLTYRSMRKSKSLHDSLSSTMRSWNNNCNSNVKTVKKAQRAKMNEFILDCNEKLEEQKRETKYIERDLKGVERVIEEVTEGFNERNAKLGQDEKFKEFMDQREFKKKLLNHFLEKIIDPQSILSHYRKKIAPV